LQVDLLSSLLALFNDTFLQCLTYMYTSSLRLFYSCSKIALFCYFNNFSIVDNFHLFHCYRIIEVCHEGPKPGTGGLIKVLLQAANEIWDACSEWYSHGRRGAPQAGHKRILSTWLAVSVERRENFQRVPRTDIYIRFVWCMLTQLTNCANTVTTCLIAFVFVIRLLLTCLEVMTAWLKAGFYSLHW
jgi:hypothetical protein